MFLNISTQTEQKYFYQKCEDKNLDQVSDLFLMIYKAVDQKAEKYF